MKLYFIAESQMQQSLESLGGLHVKTFEKINVKKK